MIRLLVLAAVVSACAAQPVVWDEPISGFEWMEAGVGYSPPSSPGICHTSFVWRPGDGVTHAAWWSVRADSTAVLMVATESRAGGWSVPEAADTMDAGRTGCRRAAPSMAVSNGSVYLAYGMNAKEGPGVFTVHWMQGMTHAPVAVVYGERFGETSIAVRGDTVVVAYEDPNTDPRRIGVAVSTTGSHLFQHRTLVSPPTGAARRPRVVLDSAGIVVVWNQTSRGETRGMSRRGRFQ